VARSETARSQVARSEAARSEAAASEAAPCEAAPGEATTILDPPEVPKSAVWRASHLDDPLYRRSVYPLRAWDHPLAIFHHPARHESLTAATGDQEVIDAAIIHRERTTRSLSPRADSRIHFDDLLNPRRSVREDFLLDDLRTKTFNDRLDCGLNQRSTYLDDPQWRRPKTQVDDRALNYYGALADPLYQQSRINALYDPVHRYSAMDMRLAGDYRLADPLYNDHLYGRTAYALDDPLNRRSAYLQRDPLYRRSALDDPLYRRSALDDPLYRHSAFEGHRCLLR